MLTLSWNPADTPPALQNAISVLAEEYPISVNGPGKLLCFESVPERRSAVTISEDRVTVVYGSLADAMRGIGAALANLNVDESTTFKTLGIMLDCSRNGVMKVEHVKKWLRRLALMGYNMAWFYTEDTYKLPGEEYFGYMRGAYTAAEIREIDDYAAALGVEVVACIQTLGHMRQLLKWNGPYAAVKDTEEVLLVDEEKTYSLIDKMLHFWSVNLRSRRIHIGMDEAHDLGRGRFMDLHGYQRGFDIFNRQLACVNDLCRKYGLQPMIWSDMYFRMANPEHEYYDLEHDIPADVAAMIPENTDIVYWDYYHEEQEFYERFIQKHQQLNRPVMMGSGAWTWGSLVHNFDKTEATVKPCIAACRKTGIDEFIITLWGDDGSYCDFDSALAGLSWAADAVYSAEECAAATESRFQAVCKASYLPQRIACGVDTAFWTDYMANEITDRYWLYLGYRILWDDPLLGIGWNNFIAQDAGFDGRALAKLSELKQALLPFAGEKEAGRVSHTLALLDALTAHLLCRREVTCAYQAEDKPRLLAALETVTAAVQAYSTLYESFREMWLDVFKPFGLETIQMRTGTIRLRYEELARRIEEFCSGQVRNIPELEENIPQNPWGFAYPVSSIMSGSCI
ncbi:MAG: family 20 glycosylhydrolase [Victivallales bacterium]|nr:family 20 glycosylhydrolase [Victivallales bacterium]